jgi:hypothetical protein
MGQLPIREPGFLIRPGENPIRLLRNLIGLAKKTYPAGSQVNLIGGNSYPVGFIRLSGWGNPVRIHSFFTQDPLKGTLHNEK